VPQRFDGSSIAPYTAGAGEGKSPPGAGQDGSPGARVLTVEPEDYLGFVFQGFNLLARSFALGGLRFDLQRC
jgi:hypothetical protein